jgi:hypothetical protein
MFDLFLFSKWTLTHIFTIIPNNNNNNNNNFLLTRKISPRLSKYKNVWTTIFPHKIFLTLCIIIRSICPTLSKTNKNHTNENMHLEMSFQQHFFFWKKRRKRLLFFKISFIYIARSYERYLTTHKMDLPNVIDIAFGRFLVILVRILWFLASFFNNRRLGLFLFYWVFLC